MQELFSLFYRLNKMVFSVKSTNFFGTQKTERGEKGREEKEEGSRERSFEGKIVGKSLMHLSL